MDDAKSRDPRVHHLPQGAPAETLVNNPTGTDQQGDRRRSRVVGMSFPTPPRCSASPARSSARSTTNGKPPSRRCCSRSRSSRVGLTAGLDALSAHISPLECLSGGASCTPLLAIIASCVVVTVRTNQRDVISGPRYVVGKLWSRRISVCCRSCSAIRRQVPRRSRSGR